MYTINPEAVKSADNLAVEKYGIPSLTLMKNAAKACFGVIFPLLSNGDKIAIICGKGGNGGDGFELARLLHRQWLDVTVIRAFDEISIAGDAKHMLNGCKNDGVRLVPMCEWQAVLEESTIIIDALFGVGFYGAIDTESDFGKMLTLANQKNVKRFAIDTPSGINSLDGRCEGVAFNADRTITFEFIKTGMLSYPAREYCGEITVKGVGYPKALIDEIPKAALICDDDYVKSTLPARAKNTHKGTYGRLLMYVASKNMTGAAYLSAMGALRSGAGLVNIARDKETIRILQTCLTEPVFSVIDENENDKAQQLLSLSHSATACLVGCGLGCQDSDKEVLFSLIKNAECNLIIDADGINLLCENKHILREAKKTPVLTPHPLELARLIGTTAQAIQQNRINYARDFAREYGCVMVLKGAGTVIASPCGCLAINTSGNPGLAKGGSGDVLAGVISSFICQGINPFDAAVVASYLHGKSADILKEQISEYGFLPSELPMAIAKLLP